MNVAKAGVEKSQMKRIPAGSLLTISAGAYSDYGISGVFRAKTVIDPELLRHDWLREQPSQAKAYSFDNNKFLVWLVRRSLIEPVDCYEWHLCDYSNISEMWVDSMATEAET